jgi:hypothetical protein
MDDSRDDLISLLKDKYDYEFDRKKTLDNALTLPVTLLSFIVAAIYFLISEVKDNTIANWFVVIKWLLFIGIMFTATVAFINLYKVYFGFRRFYSSFPSSTDIIEAYKRLIPRHEDVKKEELRERFVISDLKEYKIIWYRDCNEANTSANDRRANAFFAARLWLGFSMIICILLLIFISIIKTADVKQATPPPPPPPVRREKSDNIVIQPQIQTK